MKEIKISPSIMCCRIEEMVPYIKKFEEVDLDSIHFDIMDGHYVKNAMLGTTDYRDIKRLSRLPIDIHLMCYGPEDFIKIYDIQSGDRISFHPETTDQPYRLLQSIKEMNCKAGLVLNPGTPLNYLEECVELVDYVTLMTVNPGFAGQKMVPTALKKITRTRNMLDENRRQEADLVVDGNTTLENAKKMAKAGANIFVVGTSSIIKGLDVFSDEYYFYKKAIEESL